MQYVHYKKCYLMIIVLINILFISGCSTRQAEELPKSTPNNVSISSDELAQLKASSAQWQQAKPGIERLLVIEQDLKLLISQLNAVAKQSANSETTTQPQMAPKPTEMTTPTVEKSKVNSVAAVNEQQTVQPLFALQVAAVTEEARLTQSLNEIKASATELFSGQFVVNVETINVKGVNYYRLKLGAYQYQKSAQADCDKLKQQQISCIVNYYTEHPLKL